MVAVKVKRVVEAAPAIPDIDYRVTSTKFIYEALTSDSSDFVSQELATSKAKEIEKAIYNDTFTFAENNGIKRLWSNDPFKTHYVDKIISVCTNLNKESKSVTNTTFRVNVLNGSIDIADIPNMTPQQMNPKYWEEIVNTNNAKDNVLNSFKKNTTNDYECSNCHKSECEYYTAQIRSADEGSTIFLECIPCGFKWKIDG
jgi:transcription elongation factor S-II